MLVGAATAAAAAAAAGWSRRSADAAINKVLYRALEISILRDERGACGVGWKTHANHRLQHGLDDPHVAAHLPLDEKLEANRLQWESRVEKKSNGF